MLFFHLIQKSMGRFTHGIVRTIAKKMQPRQKDHSIFLTQVQMIKPEVNVWARTFVSSFFIIWYLCYPGMEDISYSWEIVHYAITLSPNPAGVFSQIKKWMMENHFLRQKNNIQLKMGNNTVYQILF